jgi:hypothetical protein
MTGSLFMQHTPSRFTKVAGTGAAQAIPAARELHHAHPEFSRFMAAHPRISRFIAEHPKTSRFVFRIAHHIPVIEHYVPLAPHVSSTFVHRAKPRPAPAHPFKNLF